MREQQKVNGAHGETTIQGRGRHDPAMIALVLADHALVHRAVVPPHTTPGE